MISVSRRQTRTLARTLAKMPSMCDGFSLPGVQSTLVRSSVRDRLVNQREGKIVERDAAAEALADLT